MGRLSRIRWVLIVCWAHLVLVELWRDVAWLVSDPAFAKGNSLQKMNEPKRHVLHLLARDAC